MNEPLDHPKGGSPVPQRRWATLPMYARHRGRSERVVRLWARKGYLTLYRTAGYRGVIVDMDEADAALSALADKGLIRPDHGTFGGQVIRNVVIGVAR